MVEHYLALLNRARFYRIKDLVLLNSNAALKKKHILCVYNGPGELFSNCEFVNIMLPGGAVKISPFDFVLSTFFMGLIILMTGVVGGVVLPPLWNEFFGAFSPIWNLFVFLTLYGLFSVLVFRLLIWVRPLKVGEFDMDSAEFTYWKLLTMIYFFGYRALFILYMEPFRPALLKLFGAKIGKNVAISSFVDSPFLVSIADNCIFGLGSVVSGNILMAGKIIIGPVRIETGSTIGVYSLVMPNTEMGAGSLLSPHSVLTVGSKIPPGESWKGQPARKWQ